MFNTLCVNFRDPLRRRYVAARLGGKMIGVTLVLAAIYALGYYLSCSGWHAVRMIYGPRSMMRPVSSSMLMNSLAGTG